MAIVVATVDDWDDVDDSGGNDDDDVNDDDDDFGWRPKSADVSTGTDDDDDFVSILSGAFGWPSSGDGAILNGILSITSFFFFYVLIIEQEETKEKKKTKCVFSDYTIR